MKNLSVLFLTIIISFSASAANLNTVIDDYQYAMTVEWDQRDQVFSKARTEEFYSAIQKLQENGLTVKELEAGIKAKLGDARAVQEISSALEAQDLRSMDELMNFMTSRQSEFYSRGANWSSDALIGFAEYAFIVGFVGFLVYVAVTEKCVEYGYVGTHHTCTKVEKRKFSF